MFKKKIRSFTWSNITLALACPLLLCLTQCGSSSMVGASCGSVACTGTPTCTSAANLPLCAETISAKCHSATSECVWKIKTDPNCPCMEHDVRLCNVNATTPGVQICTANAGRTATSWAACQACATCT
jgi:hypothetical protein